MRRRVSLPLADYRLSVEVEKRRQLVDEEREQYEYEIRAQYVNHSSPRMAPSLDHSQTPRRGRQTECYDPTAVAADCH